MISFAATLLLKKEAIRRKPFKKSAWLFTDPQNLE
jgi:hypothetical protein